MPSDKYAYANVRTSQAHLKDVGGLLFAIRRALSDLYVYRLSLDGADLDDAINGLKRALDEERLNAE